MVRTGYLINCLHILIWRIDIEGFLYAPLFGLETVFSFWSGCFPGFARSSRPPLNLQVPLPTHLGTLCT